jgi:ABC-type thiamine transport system substrate-binding protein
MRRCEYRRTVGSLGSQGHANPEEYAQYAREPPEPVTCTCEELAGNVDEWTGAWARQVATS